jgi:AcrR family transcriptional regulator
MVGKQRDARVERTQQVVLDASAALILERGAANFTVEAVVERTGVALTTVYRHWRSKTELLADAITHLSTPVAFPDTGSIRSDLVQFVVGRIGLEHWNEKLRTLPGIIEAGRRDEKISIVVTQFVAGLLNTIRIMLERGQERGEVRRDRDVEAMADVLLGAIVLRRGFRGEEISKAHVTAIVDTILEGIAERGRKPANSG